MMSREVFDHITALFAHDRQLGEQAFQLYENETQDKLTEFCEIYAGLNPGVVVSNDIASRLLVPTKDILPALPVAPAPVLVNPPGDGEWTAREMREFFKDVGPVNPGPHHQHLLREPRTITRMIIETEEYDY